MVKTIYRRVFVMSCTYDQYDLIFKKKKKKKKKRLTQKTIYIDVYYTRNPKDVWTGRDRELVSEQ